MNADRGIKPTPAELDRIAPSTARKRRVTTQKCIRAITRGPGSVFRKKRNVREVFDAHILDQTAVRRRWRSVSIASGANGSAATSVTPHPNAGDADVAQQTPTAMTTSTSPAVDGCAWIASASARCQHQPPGRRSEPGEPGI